MKPGAKKASENILGNPKDELLIVAVPETFRVPVAVRLPTVGEDEATRAPVPPLEYIHPWSNEVAPVPPLATPGVDVATVQSGLVGRHWGSRVWPGLYRGEA